MPDEETEGLWVHGSGSFKHQPLTVHQVMPVRRHRGFPELASRAFTDGTVENGPLAWKWLTSSEDLGMRLRRERETAVHEAHPTASGVTREGHVRDCIDARARLVR